MNNLSEGSLVNPYTDILQKLNCKIHDEKEVYNNVIEYTKDLNKIPGNITDVNNLIKELKINRLIRGIYILIREHKYAETKLFEFALSRNDNISNAINIIANYKDDYKSFDNILPKDSIIITINRTKIKYCKDTFYIYTTGMYSGEFDITNLYSSLLKSVIDNLGNRYEKINIKHYDPITDETLEIYNNTFEDKKRILSNLTKTITGELKIDIHQTYRKRFPTDLDLSNVPHIILDIAHLVQYAQKSEPYDDYKGYNKDLLKDYKYIYIGFDNFNKLKQNNIFQLFKYDKNNIIYTINDYLKERFPDEYKNNPYFASDHIKFKGYPKF